MFKLKQICITTTCLMSTLLPAANVFAQGAGFSLSGSASDKGASSNASSTSSASAPATSEEPAGQESDDIGPPWGVAPGMWEAGLYWGLFFADSKHELYDPSIKGLKFQRFENVTPELGLRLGYFPMQVLGFELEGGLIPSQTKVSGDGVNLFALRAHAVLLAPIKTVVPFITVGGGVLGLSSEDTVLGSDLDPTFHVGIGVKGFVTEKLAVRLDLRDNFTGGFQDSIAQHWEALIGISVVSGRPQPPPPPPPPADTDGDGVIDPLDACPGVAGIASEDSAKHGCPPPPDTDGDGINDELDRCPTLAGIANTDAAKHGCPPPPPDGDNDGVADDNDKCPTVAGDGADGCLLDSDADGIFNKDDKCADQPETKNNFEDQDGCPDELPETVKKFTGAIKGIAFDANKATIRATSFATLDEAAKVLIEYPALRMEVSGHTDSSGKADRNLTLSAERAEAVKAYFVSKGVAAERIMTRGAGSAEAVGDNKTAEGRAQNRRIEFKLIQ